MEETSVWRAHAMEIPPLSERPVSQEEEDGAQAGPGACAAVLGAVLGAAEQASPVRAAPPSTAAVRVGVWRGCVLIRWIGVSASPSSC